MPWPSPPAPPFTATPSTSRSPRSTLCAPPTRTARPSSSSRRSSATWRWRSPTSGQSSCCATSTPLVATRAASSARTPRACPTISCRTSRKSPWAASRRSRSSAATTTPPMAQACATTFTLSTSPVATSRPLTRPSSALARAPSPTTWALATGPRCWRSSPPWRRRAARPSSTRSPRAALATSPLAMPSPRRPRRSSIGWPRSTWPPPSPTPGTGRARTRTASARPRRWSGRRRMACPRASAWSSKCTSEHAISRFIRGEALCHSLAT
mmetsp:Transcript_19671/g.49710  ORF Transcript_19671/g.49710 Transcript_19671/m.49710 type:complete len:268 (-) Transcript_19671:105-908(-)